MTDGKSLLRALRQMLGESSSSVWMDDRSSYEAIYTAATKLVGRTDALHSTQSITTVANQRNYTLNADFMKLYLKNSGGDFYIKYNDGTTDHFLLPKPYGELIYGNNTASVAVPDSFAIIDDPTKDAQVAGTCTSAGALSAGQATLTDSAADFNDVSAGDLVHNTTDGSTGYVLSKTSSTVLVTALFDGTENDWDSSDAYVIQPQGRMQLILDPPPSTASHTITIYYTKRPDPVFSDYGIYRIPAQYSVALINLAAWFYKYRDREPNFGDAWYKFFESETKGGAIEINKAFQKNKFGVYFKK